MNQDELKEALQSVIGLGGEDAFRQVDEFDSNGLGVRRARDHLAVEKGLLVSQYVSSPSITGSFANKTNDNSALVRRHLTAIDPGGLVRRWPGWNRPFRAVLQSHGYAEEWCADGHEKLADRGLGLGSAISFEIYGIKDKYSSFFVALECVPNARDRATVAHIYLDAVEREGGESRFQVCV
jgi:hypothetical protein